MTFNHSQLGRRAAGRLVAFSGLAIVALVLAACAGAQPGAARPVAPTQPQPVTTVPSGSLTRSAAVGAVTVELTPLNLGDIKASTLDFKVVMNTHSVELGVDLAKLAVLEVGDNEVAAKVWQGPAGGGHHVQGTLSFPGVNAASKPVLEGAKSITVVIRNLAGMPERKFTWNVGQAG